jgi:hypothetical protein
VPFHPVSQPGAELALPVIHQDQWAVSHGPKLH